MLGWLLFADRLRILCEEYFSAWGPQGFCDGFFVAKSAIQHFADRLGRKTLLELESFDCVFRKFWSIGSL